MLVDARSRPFDKLAAYERRFFPEVRDSFWHRGAPPPSARRLVAAVKRTARSRVRRDTGAVTASRIGAALCASRRIVCGDGGRAGDRWRAKRLAIA